MPGFDRSGPMGAGPMTGGNRGMCTRPANVVDRSMCARGYGYGHGTGFRRGGGRGWGQCAGPAYRGYGSLPDSGYSTNTIDEIEMLRSNADAMQRSLEALQGKIAELEKENSE